MFIEILIAQSERKDPLADEILNGMLDPFGLAMITKALREALEQSQLVIGLAQQQRAAIGADATALERGVSRRPGP